MPTLHWIGKEKVTNHHLDIPYHTLDLQYNFGLNQDLEDLKDAKDSNSDNPSNPTNQVSDNLIIHADNLLALKSLLPQYEGRIKCIYIDPPYNTGNEGWVYNDNVSSPRFKKWLGQVVGKEGEDLTRHDKWLCMMYPRLKLLHKLLAEDGAIFISIDDNEQSNLKLILDEIFGHSNFIAKVAVVNNWKGRSDDKFIATAHESLFIFQKGNFSTNGVPMPEEYVDEYKLKDDLGLYRLQGLRKRGSNAREIDRPNLYYPIYFNPIDNSISIEKNNDSIEITPKLSNGENGTWRWGKETLISRLDEIEVRIVKARNEYDVFQKDYLIKDNVSKRSKPKSVWFGSEFSSETGTLQLKKILGTKVFDTPKSVDLVEYCLQQATDKDSIILDSFAGSGTTAHAVLNLNKQDGGKRKFILIEMEDYAETITAERVKRVINGYGKHTPDPSQEGNNGTGGSFSFYTLGERVLDDEQNLNPNLALHKIHGYIWYSETHTAYTQKATAAGYLGKYNNTGIYFHYQPHQVTVLDDGYLMNVTELCEQYIMYADICLLPETLMHKHNIIFKKIPRDISKL